MYIHIYIYIIHINILHIYIIVPILETGYCSYSKSIGLAMYDDAHL